MNTDWIDSLEPAQVVPQDANPHIVTMGSFDGVHRGHQFLIGQVVDRATSLGMTSLVLTFDPLPAQVLRPESAPSMLTSIQERLDIMADLSVEKVAVLKFSHTVAAIPPKAFLLGLTSRYSVAEVWAGGDFAFGHDRKGTIDFLAKSTSELGFGLHVVPRKNLDGATLSSSHVRKLLEEGHVREARVLLGYYPRLTGMVERGAGRGKQLGFPTANLRIPTGHVVPQSGIYAGFGWVGGRRLTAAISIGNNPTFGVNPLSVEAFLLDFDEELVGERMRLDFVDRLRPEKYFESVDELVAQMRMDVEHVRELIEVELSESRRAASGVSHPS